MEIAGNGPPMGMPTGTTLFPIDQARLQCNTLLNVAISVAPSHRGLVAWHPWESGICDVASTALIIACALSSVHRDPSPISQ